MILGILAGVLVATAAQAEPGAAAPKARPTRIAVLDVQASGNLDRRTVEGLSSLLASEVARRPSLAVLAGSDLRALVGFERQKQLLGCTDSSCLTEIVGALGVSYLVGSEISKVGSSWLFSLTLLDANRAVSLKRLTRRAFSDDELVDQAPEAVDELLGAMPGLPPPPPRSAPLPMARPAGGVLAPETLPGYHAHDGFFLRMQLGFGAMSSSGGGLETSGSSGAFSFDAGASLTENLAVYGTMIVEVSTSPTAKVNSVSQTGTLTHTVEGYGLGATWYFLPSNVYVGATAGFGNAKLDVDNAGGKTSASTKNGFLGRLTVGKEWWASPNWGLGVALDLTGSSFGALEGAKGANRYLGAGIAFSATYN